MKDFPAVPYDRWKNEAPSHVEHRDDCPVWETDDDDTCTCEQNDEREEDDERCRL